MSVERLENLRAEAHYARERYQLYKAKAYGPRPTSSARLRELQRIYEYVEARLHAVEAEEHGAPNASAAEPGSELTRQPLPSAVCERGLHSRANARNGLRPTSGGQMRQPLPRPSGERTEHRWIRQRLIQRGLDRTPHGAPASSEEADEQPAAGAVGKMINESTRRRSALGPLLWSAVVRRSEQQGSPVCATGSSLAPTRESLTEREDQ